MGHGDDLVLRDHVGNFRRIRKIFALRHAENAEKCRAWSSRQNDSTLKSDAGVARMRRGVLIVVAVLLSQAVGCALFHELQPHRIRRLNRTPAPVVDPEFNSQLQGHGFRCVASAADGAASPLS